MKIEDFIDIFECFSFKKNLTFVRDHPLSTYAKFSEKLIFAYGTGAYQGVRNASFSENFAYVLNG